MFVKPAPGLKVRHPVTRTFLPDEGIEVADGDLFWTRVLNDGDVVEISEDEFKAAQQKAEAEAQAAADAKAKADAEANDASHDQPAAADASHDQEGEKQ
jgi:hypothetical protein